MKFQGLVARVQHGFKRRDEALNNLIRRIALSIIGIDISRQTEIQYIELGKFDSKILSKTKYFDAQEVSISKKDYSMAHNFDSRWIIEISNVIVNTETNHVYATNLGCDEVMLIKESTEWPTDRVLIGQAKQRFKNLRVIPYAKLGLPNSGFYHWMSEDLPSLLGLPPNMPTLNYRKVSFLNESILKKRGDFLIQTQKWVFVEKLLFISRGKDLGYIHPQNLKSLKDFFSDKEQSNTESPSRIYISRSKTRRALPGEAELEDYLRKRDFLVVHAEEYDLFKQRALSKDAKIVIGSHGAGLIHSIWASDCQLVELMPLDRINRCFEWQTLLQSNSYSRIYFDSKENSVADVINQLEGANLF